MVDVFCFCFVFCYSEICSCIIDTTSLSWRAMFSPYCFHQLCMCLRRLNTCGCNLHIWTDGSQVIISDDFSNCRRGLLILFGTTVEIWKKGPVKVFACCYPFITNHIDIGNDNQLNQSNLSNLCLFFSYPQSSHRFRVIGLVYFVVFVAWQSA